MFIMLFYIGFKINAGWFYWVCYFFWLYVRLAAEKFKK